MSNGLNRRQFTTSLGALAGAASLPIGGALAAPTATAAATSGDSYLWASFVARVQGKVTPETLMNGLKMAPDQAGKVLAQLVQDNVVSPANVNGVFSTVNPISNSWMQSGNLVQDSAEKLVQAAKDKAKDFVEEEFEELQEEAPQEATK